MYDVLSWYNLNVKGVCVFGGRGPVYCTCVRLTHPVLM